MSLYKGIVLKSTGSWYTVLRENGERMECRLKGQFRIKGLNLKNTNPIAVGDHVGIEMDTVENVGMIAVLEERKNYIIRRSTNLSKQTHIIAANIDHAYVMATLIQPRTSTGFIDRFLVTAEAYGIPASVIFNKRDLLDEEYSDYVKALIGLYEGLGYSCFFISATNEEQVAELRNKMIGKTNLIAGHSGVGKSTLINALEPELAGKTGIMSKAHSKGKHTTTFAEMHQLKSGGFIIDTPGIKEFGIVDLEKQELCHYFPEMRKLLGQCKYDGCVHDKEPFCAVKAAVENGEIALTRYECYLQILNGEELQKAYD
ncbi:ribosome small subunit-dependent GTPase A [soil metagenome]